MFILKDGAVWDPDLDFLAEILFLLDKQRMSMTGAWKDAETADSCGVFDSAEHITGLGFVACQAYITATHGFLKVEKSSALAFGPRHKTGKSVVKIIHHAANYWKHHDEWPLDKSAANQDRIRIAFDEVGISAARDYPLSGILTTLAEPEPPAFKPLIGKLASWRDDLRRGTNPIPTSPTSK
jgi:hypothetical protein